MLTLVTVATGIGIRCFRLLDLNLIIKESMQNVKSIAKAKISDKIIFEKKIK